MSTQTSQKSDTASRSTRANGVAERRLYYLYDLTDFKVHHDDKDVRGWDVKTNLGTKIGTVGKLIVDKPAKKVRYLEVNLDANFSSQYADSGYYLDKKNATSSSSSNDIIHFLIPIGMVSLNEDDQQIEIDGVSVEVIGASPRYRRGSELRPSYEFETLNHYADHHQEYGSTFDRSRYRNFDDNLYGGIDDQFYTSGFFNSDRFYNRHKESISSKGL